MEDVRKSWEKFLHPETLRGNMIAISLFISAFEMFKDCIIEKPKTLFLDGFDENGPIINEQYKTEVLSKSKSPLYASLFWFKEIGAVNDADIKTFDDIRVHRNEVVHELTEYLSNVKKELNISHFQNLVGLLSKIEKWWFTEFEMAITPDIFPDKVNIGEVIPGPILILQLMLDIALGDEPEEGFYYNAFRNKHT